MLNDLMSKKFYAELSEGEHTSTLKNWQYCSNSTDPSKDYIKMTFEVTNHNVKQPFTRNFFERDVSIMLSHLRRQLERTTEAIDPKEFFDGLVKNETEFKLWIAYPIVPTQRGLEKKQNVNFLPPLVKVEPEVDDSTEELPEGIGA